MHQNVSIVHIQLGLVAGHEGVIHVHIFIIGLVVELVKSVYLAKAGEDTNQIRDQDNVDQFEVIAIRSNFDAKDGEKEPIHGPPTGSICQYGQNDQDTSDQKVANDFLKQTHFLKYKSFY